MRISALALPDEGLHEVQVLLTRPHDFAGLNELIGTPDMLALGKRYDAPTRPSGSKGGTRRLSRKVR